jgi:hypothetical protein
MSLNLDMFFNLRHVSAAYGPSSGKLLISGEATALSTSVLPGTSLFCCVSFLEYCLCILFVAIMVRMYMCFGAVFPYYCLIYICVALHVSTFPRSSSDESQEYQTKFLN